MQPKDGSLQEQQPSQFVSGANGARDRRNRGTNRRSTETALGKQHTSGVTRLPKVNLCSLLDQLYTCNLVTILYSITDYS